MGWIRFGACSATGLCCQSQQRDRVRQPAPIQSSKGRRKKYEGGSQGHQTVCRTRQLGYMWYHSNAAHRHVA